MHYRSKMAKTSLSSFPFVFLLGLGSSSLITEPSTLASGIIEFFDYNEPLQGNETCSLISIVMDESTSMDGEQDFMKHIAVPEILHRLKDAGVDNVFICSHGFGSQQHDPWGQNAGHFHGCSEGAADGIVSSSIMETWVSQGRHEDGWQAIHFAARDTPARINGKSLVETCKTLGKNMILVTDEERYDNSCDGHLFQMELHTDHYAAETSWILEDSKGNVVLEDGVFFNNQVLRVTTCLEDDGVHTLTFFDSYHDGFCCIHGEGYYKVWYDNKLIVDSLGDFVDEISIIIPGGGDLGFIEDLPSSSSSATAEPHIAVLNAFSRENTLQELLDTGYRLDVISNLTMTGLRLDGVPLGVSSDSVVFETDNTGSFVGNMGFSSQQPMVLVDWNQMAEDYATIAFNTGGAAWSLGSLRRGGNYAQSFAAAFTAINAQEIEDDTFSTLSPTMFPTEAVPTADPTAHPTPTATVGNNPPFFNDEEAIIDSSRMSSRDIVGIVVGTLVATALIAFFIHKNRRRVRLENGTVGGSIEEDAQFDSNEDPSIVDDDSFLLPSLAQCMDFAASFRWDNDHDHLVDLSDLAGELA